MQGRKRGSSPAQIVSAVAWLVVALGVMALLTGCAGTPKARPNKPGHVTATHTTFDKDGNKKSESSLSGTNDENPDEGVGGRIDPDGGVSVNTGGSVPFEWDQMTGQPLAWGGFGLIVLGLGLMVLSKFPIAGLVVPPGVGWISIGLGFGVFFIPFVGPAVKTTLQIVLPFMAVMAVFFYGKKAKWFETATGAEAQMERIAKGDTGGAAAMAFINSGGDRDKARKVKNGTSNGTLAAPPGRSIIPAAAVTIPGAVAGPSVVDPLGHTMI